MNGVVAQWKSCPTVLALQGVVQHYAWGGHEFIPALLGQACPAREPCAEFWMGSHAQGPSCVRLGADWLPLPELLDQAAAELLGPDLAGQFQGGLPYLFKVLDARQMLSLQAHPTLEQAAAGYEREERTGLALHAPHRNYKDRNHKPEVHVALTDFWMLHGFRPLTEMARIMEAVPELRWLGSEFGTRLSQAAAGSSAEESVLREVYQRIMTLPQSEVDACLDALLGRLQSAPPPPREDPAFWVLRAAEQFPLPDGHRDRGIFSIYLLNLVHLQPGQGTYQAAGTLHAYLEGVNVELMANSDNVLRGGLTPKHVDGPELLRVLEFSGRLPEVIPGRPVSAVETVYATPAAEFELSRIELAVGQSYQRAMGCGPEILLVMAGEVTAHDPAGSLSRRRGEAMLIAQPVACRVDAQSAGAVLYKAAVPRPSASVVSHN